MNLGNFDIFILFLFSFCGIIGLIRGFIKEIFSIINWILSFYIVSILKPLCLDSFSEMVKIPFLSDILLNLILFAVVMMILSIVSKIISTILKKIIPTSVDVLFGFIFGILKAFIILFLIVSTIRILYNDDNPKILKNSVFNQLFIQNDTINDKIKVLLGDFLNEKKKKIEEQVIENIKDDIKESIEDKYKDTINKKNIDIIEKKIDNLTNSKIIEDNITDNIKNLDNEIENILEKL